MVLHPKNLWWYSILARQICGFRQRSVKLPISLAYCTASTITMPLVHMCKMEQVLTLDMGLEAYRDSAVTMMLMYEIICDFVLLS